MKVRRLIALALGLFLVVAYFNPNITEELSSWNSGAKNTPPTKSAGGKKTTSTAGAHFKVRCGEANTLSLDADPWNLTEGGKCSGRLQILSDGGCVKIYNANMKHLVDDRKGKFFDLTGKGAAYYASCDSTPVQVKFTSW